MVQSVLVLGATGNLGRTIVDALLKKKDDYEVTILVREGGDSVLCSENSSSQNKTTLIESFASKGAKVVYGDAANAEEMKKAATGIDTVVSAVGGSIARDGSEKKVIEAAAAAGVKRFVPAQFTSDYTQLPDDRKGYMYQLQASIVKAIQDAGMEFTVVITQAWYQYAIHPLCGLDLKNEEITLIEGGNQKVSTMDMRDVGPFLAEILLDDYARNRYIRLEGSTLTRRQIKTVIEQATGKKMKTKEVNMEQWLKQLEGKEKDMFLLFFVKNQETCIKNPGFACVEGRSDNWRYPNVIARSLKEYLQGLE